MNIIRFFDRDILKNIFVTDLLTGLFTEVAIGPRHLNYLVYVRGTSQKLMVTSKLLCCLMPEILIYSSFNFRHSWWCDKGILGKTVQPSAMYKG